MSIKIILLVAMILSCNKISVERRIEMTKHYEVIDSIKHLNDSLTAFINYTHGYDDALRDINKLFSDTIK